MFYFFEQVPQAQPADLQKSFDHLSTPPEVSKLVYDITGLRNHFFATMGQLTTKPITEIVEVIEWEQLLTYMNKTPDLLELGVKKANFPFVLNYQPFSNPGQVVSCNNGKLLNIVFNFQIMRSQSRWRSSLPDTCMHSGS